MKRRLPAKLVLLVKARHNALTTTAAAAAAAAGGSPSGAAVSSSWTFPHTRHQPGETIRQAAERALKEAIGPSQVSARVRVQGLGGRVVGKHRTLHQAPALAG